MKTPINGFQKGHKGYWLGKKRKLSHGIFLKGHSVSEKIRKQCGDIWRGKHSLTAFKKGHLKPENAYSFLKGEKNPSWNGGKKKIRGYWYIHKPEHPFATKQGYVKKSRLVMEQEINRFLEPSEVIHHKNGIINDDMIENLMLFDNQSEHQKFHIKQKYEERN